MIQSGLIQTDARLNNITGVLAELPFFDQLDYTEALIPRLPGTATRVLT